MFLRSFYTRFLRLRKTYFFFVFSVLAISVPFLLATIWIYLYVPQLRCLHNSCLICFLGTFAIGTSLLSSTAWITYDMEACRVIGSPKPLYKSFYFSHYIFVWIYYRFHVLFLHDIRFLLAEYYLLRFMVEYTWYQIWAPAEQSTPTFCLLFHLCVDSGRYFYRYRYNYRTFEYWWRLETGNRYWAMFYKMCVHVYSQSIFYEKK